jgi:hypothetical protein
VALEMRPSELVALIEQKIEETTSAQS